jgi:molybdopterin converting factor small subunit
MPKVVFTPNIQRHVACPDVVVAAATVRDALDAVFAANSAARSYVLDDQGALRRHMAIYVDSRLIADRVQLSDTLAPDATVYVFQALSGG